MHASIWKFRGDPDRLLAAYEAMLEEIGAASMRLHLCLRAPDGIVLVDTCPNEEAYRSFSLGEGFASVRERHGLPDPVELEDHPVHAAFVGGQRTS